LQQTFLAAFRGALTISAAIAAIGVFAALVRGDERVRRPSGATLDRYQPAPVDER